MGVQLYTESGWLAEGARRFGPDMRYWKFKCPVCGIVTMAKEWDEAGASNSIAYACIGRFTKANRKAFGTTEDKREGPCNYTGGGLLQLNPVRVRMDSGELDRVFDFAE